MNFKALNDIESLVSQAPDLTAERKKAITEKIQEARTPLETDKWIV